MGHLSDKLESLDLELRYLYTDTVEEEEVYLCPPSLIDDECNDFYLPKWEWSKTLIISANTTKEKRLTLSEEDVRYDDLNVYSLVDYKKGFSDTQIGKLHSLYKGYWFIQDRIKEFKLPYLIRPKEYDYVDFSVLEDADVGKIFNLFNDAVANYIMKFYEILDKPRYES